MDKETFYSGRADTRTCLYVSSIFSTIDGETNRYHAGTWSTFIRLQGCRVGCEWCDTKYSWPIHRGGMPMEMTDILTKVRDEPCHKVTITGGEPMEQWGDALAALLHALHGWGYKITMETAGTEPLDVIVNTAPFVNLIVDWKMPSANAVRFPILDNYARLRDDDVVKIVTKLEEVRWIPEVVATLRRLRCRARLVFSPVWEQSSQLVEFIKAARVAELHRLNVGISLQTHKFIWPHSVRDEEEGGVDLKTKLELDALLQEANK